MRSPPLDVWYLSHPLAADDKYTFEQNVAHCKKMVRLCLDCGYRVIAPYLTLVEVLDENNTEHRRIGLEIDCSVAYSLGRIILCGHKMSRGMREEYESVVRRGLNPLVCGLSVIDLIGQSPLEMINSLEKLGRGAAASFPAADVKPNLEGL